MSINTPMSLSLRCICVNVGVMQDGVGVRSYMFIVQGKIGSFFQDSALEGWEKQDSEKEDKKEL